MGNAQCNCINEQITGNLDIFNNLSSLNINIQFYLNEYNNFLKMILNKQNENLDEYNNKDKFLEFLKNNNNLYDIINTNDFINTYDFKSAQKKYRQPGVRSIGSDIIIDMSLKPIIKELKIYKDNIITSLNEIILSIVNENNNILNIKLNHIDDILGIDCKINTNFNRISSKLIYIKENKIFQKLLISYTNNKNKLTDLKSFIDTKFKISDQKKVLIDKLNLIINKFNDMRILIYNINTPLSNINSIDITNKYNNFDPQHIKLDTLACYFNLNQKHMKEVLDNLYTLVHKTTDVYLKNNTYTNNSYYDTFTVFDRYLKNHNTKCPIDLPINITYMKNINNVFNDNIYKNMDMKINNNEIINIKDFNVMFSSNTKQFIDSINKNFDFYDYIYKLFTDESIYNIHNKNKCEKLICSISKPGYCKYLSQLIYLMLINNNNNNINTYIYYKFLLFILSITKNFTNYLNNLKNNREISAEEKIKIENIIKPLNSSIIDLYKSILNPLLKRIIYMDSVVSPTIPVTGKEPFYNLGDIKNNMNEYIVKYRTIQTNKKYFFISLILLIIIILFKNKIFNK